MIFGYTVRVTWPLVGGPMIFMVGIELKNGSQILEFKKKGTS